MQTPYDWITVAIFAAIVVLFLQRSVGDSPVEDSLLSYFPPAIGCAVANQFGNNGYDAIAIAMIFGVVAYCWLVLKPFAGRS
jgi:NhaP-type Na+/H+ or K+/H+ antiporter